MIVSDIIVAMLQAAGFSPETHVKVAVKANEEVEVPIKITKGLLS